MKKANLKIMFPVLGAAGIAAGGCASSQGQKPNVIIIYADDLGFGDISCNGSETISTPNVDALASDGIRFVNAHSTSSVSTPSRYGLLTGQYPWRKNGTGIAAGNAGMIIRPEQYTLADMFCDAGYATAAVGKWHLGIGETAIQDWNGTVTPNLSDIGFQYSYIMAATGDRVPCVFIENGKVDGLDPSDPIEVSYEKPFPGEPTGKDNPELLRMHPSHGHDQAIVNGISRIGYMKGGKAALWRDEDIADRITEKSLDFIAEHKDGPFFLYFGTNDIHVPRVPHERFVGKSGMGPRGDAILSFDETVGKVVAHLKKLGIYDNTLIILSSDNGPVVDDGYKDQAVELLGEHKPWGEFRGGKYSAFEAGTRVPMIVHWSKAAKGKVSDALVSHIDFFASLASLAGMTIPEGAAPDSRNALETLKGSGKGRDYVIEQNPYYALSVLDADGWKYIAPTNGPAKEVLTNTELGNSREDQLYRLSKGTSETENLAGEYPEDVARLKKILFAEKDLGTVNTTAWQ